VAGGPLSDDATTLRSARRSMRVFSNSAMSADGKLGTFAHDHVAIGSAEDRRRMQVLRAQADAVLVGGKTFRNWPLPLVEDPGALRPEEERGPRSRPMINAVITRRGLLDARERPGRWPDPRVELLVFTGPGVDAGAHRDRFGAELFALDDLTVDAVLRELKRRGCRSVLVEGGGDLIFAVLSAGWLDELFITLCPMLIGGASAPTPLDGPGLRADALVDLRLVDVERVDEELFLHYEVRRGTSEVRP